MHMFLAIVSIFLLIASLAVCYYYTKENNKEVRDILAQTRVNVSKDVSSMNMVIRLNYDAMNKRLQVLEEVNNKKVKASAKKPA